jgi:hypothetical protein
MVSVIHVHNHKVRYKTARMRSARGTEQSGEQSDASSCQRAAVYYPVRRQHAVAVRFFISPVVE